jgi:ATP-dependent Clp protease ATP-binding subunit ClpA
MSIANTSKKTQHSNGALVRSLWKKPDVATTIEMLRGLRHRYEEHHQLVIGDDAIDAAVRLSRFIIN